MAYGQQTANTQQTTLIKISAGSWVAMEASSTNAAISGATSALAHRFATKIRLYGKAADRLRLSYDNTIRMDDASDELGSGNVIVEPNSTGMTLYGWIKVGTSGDKPKVVIVEYGT